VDLEPQRSQNPQRDTELVERLLPASAATSNIYPHSELTRQIIGAAIEVHRELGPGFLEKVYESALKIELGNRGLDFASQVSIPISYKGQPIGTYVADLVVGNVVLCEIKAIDALAAIHEAQLLNYLKATGIQVGLLLNFGRTRTEVKRLIH